MRGYRLARIAATGASLLWALGLSVVPPAGPARAQPDRPNVLLIVTDDQRDRLQAMPQTRGLLARRGVTYDNAYVPTPMCCPARATILTGLLAHNHGVLHNSLGAELDHDLTLQRFLDEAGYRTGLFGKFLNRWGAETPLPYFDRWVVYGAGEAEDDEYYDSVFNDNGRQRVLGQYSTDFISRRSATFIRRSDEANDARPWFLLVAPNAPHVPYTPEPDYAEAEVAPWKANEAVFETDQSDKPAFVQESSATPRKGRGVRREQLRTLMSVDDMVGNLGATLTDLDELSDTLIVFLSDNGIFWSEHGLRGKGAPYQQAIEIPMLMRWDGHLAAGSIDDRLVGSVDLAPTILDAAGLSGRPDHELDGRSLLDTGWSRPRLIHEYWPSERSIRPRWASTHTEAYQYSEYYDENGSVIFSEYYDLVSDPWELTNLLADGNLLNDPDVSALSAQLAQDRTCAGSTCP